MIRVPQKTAKSSRESIIPLINIVFLMLIFFLVAGTLTKPLDQDVDMVSLFIEENAPPPDMVFVRADGTLSWQGDPVDVSAIKERWSEAQYNEENEETVMRIVADRNLQATTLLEKLEELRAAGAHKIMLVTKREGK